VSLLRRGGMVLPHGFFKKNIHHAITAPDKPAGFQ
jgi:hypothetical protein